MSKLFTLSLLAVLFFGAVQPVFANVKIEDIVINHDLDDQSEPLSVTVEIFNAGDKATYPGKVRLEVRGNSDLPWQSLRVWNLGVNAFVLDAGEHYWLDYEPLADDTVVQDLFDGNYEIRAIVDDASRPYTR